MIEEMTTPDYKNTHTEIDSIISDLVDAHQLLAKTSLPSVEYNEISHILADVKLRLVTVRKCVVAMYDGIDVGQEMYTESQADLELYKELYDLTEKQRQEWAALSIRLKEQIEARDIK